MTRCPRCDCNFEPNCESLGCQWCRDNPPGDGFPFFFDCDPIIALYHPLRAALYDLREEIRTGLAAIREEMKGKE